MAKQLTRRKFIQLTALGAGVGVLAACAPTAAPVGAPAAQPTAAAGAAAPAAGPAAGGTLNIGYGQKTSFSHLMHLRSYAGGETIYNRLMVQGKLVQLREPTKEFYPDLAESWEFAEDGMTLTFFLRQGLKWHDGEPFTAKDVEFTFLMAGLDLGGYILTRYLAPYVVGVQEYIDAEAETISGLVVVDEYTVRFDLIKPVNGDLLLGAFNYTCMAPQHILSEYLNREKAQDILQSEWATTAKHVGIGPFKVVEYVADQYIVYEPYADYHFGAPKLSGLVYRSYQDRQTVAAAIEKQEIDVGWIPDTEYARMQALDYLTFRTPKATLTVGTVINGAQPHLQDKRVRQALLHAIDRDTIIAKIYAGASEKIDTLIQLPKFGDSPDLPRYDYDPEKAKQLLAEAGWDGQTPIRWLTDQIPSDTSIWDAINGYWAEVGVTGEFQINADLSAGRGPAYDFDLYWSSYPIGHPTEFASYFDSRSAESYYTGLDSPRYEELVDQSVLPLPDEEMKTVIYEMQELLADEARFLMICPTPNIWAINTRVHEILPIYAATGFNDWGGMQNVWVDG
ncbi:MAG: ABC transporter substrate-binding protein [Caldilineaceae bacterium]|nr:ABC transporter substrate-binding protein [Caldilineaceae bacterium]